MGDNTTLETISDDALLAELDELLKIPSPHEMPLPPPSSDEIKYLEKIYAREKDNIADIVNSDYETVFQIFKESVEEKRSVVDETNPNNQVALQLFREFVEENDKKETKRIDDDLEDQAFVNSLSIRTSVFNIFDDFYGEESEDNEPDDKPQFASKREFSDLEDRVENLELSVNDASDHDSEIIELRKRIKRLEKKSISTETVEHLISVAVSQQQLAHRQEMINLMDKFQKIIEGKE
jgi:hypothetical protein